LRQTIAFFFSSRRRHTRFSRDWSSDVCSSDLSAHSWGPHLGANEKSALPRFAPSREGFSPGAGLRCEPMPTHRAPRFTPFRRHVSHVLLACAVFGAVATIPRVSHAADTVTFPTFSLADLQHDFDRLQNIAETQHPLIYADRAELQSAFALERTRLRDGMN